MCEKEFTDKFSSLRKPSVLSLNIQSLASKFVELCAVIYSLMAKNYAPDIICLQEIWRQNDAQGGGGGGGHLQQKQPELHFK